MNQRMMATRAWRPTLPPSNSNLAALGNMPGLAVTAENSLTGVADYQGNYGPPNIPAGYMLTPIPAHTAPPTKKVTFAKRLAAKGYKKGKGKAGGKDAKGGKECAKGNGKKNSKGGGSKGGKGKADTSMARSLRGRGSPRK